MEVIDTKPSAPFDHLPRTNNAMIPATRGKSKGFAGFVFEITDEVAEQAKFELIYLSVDNTTLEPDKSLTVSSKRHKNKERKKK